MQLFEDQGGVSVMAFESRRFRPRRLDRRKSEEIETFIPASLQVESPARSLNKKNMQLFEDQGGIPVTAL